MLSTPAAEHQTDIEGYICRERAEEMTFLEAFGTHGEVVGERVLVSFPSYRSAWGGHLFTHVPIPWVHLLFPDREVLDLWREIHSKAVAWGEVRCSAKRARGIIDAEMTTALWDCNGMTISRFLDLVDRAPLEVKEIRFKTLGNLAEFVTRMPKLRESLVTRLMIVLEA